VKTLLSDPSATFYTTGDGLRGVPVLVMDRDSGELIHSRVYSNTAKRLTLDVPLPRNPDRYDAYVLGAHPFAIESGDLTFGHPRVKKSLRYATFEFEPHAKGSFAVYLAADQTDREQTAWQFAGYVPLGKSGFYRLSFFGVTAATGMAIRYCLLSTVPGQQIPITHVSFEFDMEANFA